MLAGAGLAAGLDGAAVIRAGLKRIAFNDIGKVLPAKRWSAELRLENGAAAFAAVTTSDDLEAQMQVLAAYLLDPARPPPTAPGETGGPIEAIVVGDVTPEKAIAAVAATLGALPAAAGVAPAAPATPSAAKQVAAEIAGSGGDTGSASSPAIQAARAALLARLDKSEHSNAWWLDALSYVDLDPVRLARLRSRRAALLRVTLAEVRAAGRR